MFSVEYDLKPPPFSAMNLAALLAPAIIEGSSTAIGIYIYFPLIRKLSPSPNGIEIFPMQFSTIRSALCKGKPPSSKFWTFI